MTLDDLPHVDAIEQASFSAPWSINTFRHEIQSNPRSFYWVARPLAEQDSGQDSGMAPPPIFAYGGYWLMGEEAHIVVLATHPQWRQRAGKAVLIEMLAQMRSVDVKVTLEVRSGNVAAGTL